MQTLVVLPDREGSDLAQSVTFLLRQAEAAVRASADQLLAGTGLTLSGCAKDI